MLVTEHNITTPTYWKFDHVDVGNTDHGDHTRDLADKATKDQIAAAEKAAKQAEDAQKTQEPKQDQTKNKPENNRTNVL